MRNMASWNKIPEGNKCYRCGNEARVRERTEQRKYVCKSCWNKDYYKHAVKNDPNSQSNIIKLLSKRRTGNLTDPRNVIGDRFQLLACQWKGLKDLNKENNNYTNSIDCYDPITKLKYEVKGRTFGYDGRCVFSHLGRELNKKFDFLICFCADETGNYIERIYIFSREELIDRNSFSIIRNHIKQWYEEYRINEEELKKVNKIWKEIIKEER